MATGVAGGQRWLFTIQAGGHIAIVGIGFIPIADGIGLRIIRGAGPRFTTGAGSIIRDSAGAGIRARSGARPG